MNAKPVAELRRTIRISIIEGMFSQAHGSIVAPGSIFLTKYAVMLGAQPLHFGILAAIGQLSQIVQPYGTVLTRRVTSRKKIILPLLNISRTAPLLFGLLPFFLAPTPALWGFLGLFLLCSILNALAGNLWIAWISDMIPMRIRGRFFSARSRYLMVAGLITGYLMGGVIDLVDANAESLISKVLHSWDAVPHLEGLDLPWVFVGMFGIAVALGAGSTTILARQPENPKQIEQQTFRELLGESLRDGNFRTLLVYGVWWMLAVGIAAPFWGPFMLQKLQMSMLEIQLYGTISTLSALASLKAWGKLIDRAGNKTAMKFSLLLGGLNPMLWMFATPERTWIVYAESITSGIMWAGAGIVGTNFVLAIAPKGRSQIYSGIYGALNGIAMMLTMMLSGILLPDPHVFLGLHLEPEQVLFGIAGIARWTTYLPLTFITEPRVPTLGSPWSYFRYVAFLLRTQGKQWFHKQ